MEFAEYKNPEVDSFFDELKEYIIKKSSVIATQKLYFSLESEATKNELIVRLYAPVQIDTSIPVAAKMNGSFVCYVDFSHLCYGHFLYGCDEFQAINFASNLDPFLRALDKKCNLYSSDSSEHEFYFCDACNHR